MNMKKVDEKIKPQGYKSRKEIANEYNICRKTLYRWIKEKELRLSKGLLSIEEQELIYQTFGTPINK